jgi:hypothetical protein
VPPSSVEAAGVGLVLVAKVETRRTGAGGRENQRNGKSGHHKLQGLTTSQYNRASMAILKVARMGHPVLRAKALPVPPARITTAGVQRLIDSMFETMREYTGIGWPRRRCTKASGFSWPGVREGVIGDAVGDDENMPLMR